MNQLTTKANIMTNTDKPVKRRTLTSHDHRGRRLVIQVGPGDQIGFREERKRKWFHAPIADLYAQTVMWNVRRDKAEKKARGK